MNEDEVHREDWSHDVALFPDADNEPEGEWQNEDTDVKALKIWV